MLDTVFQTKGEIRRRVIAARDALPPEYRRQASQKIAAHIIGLSSFLRARTVLLFSPFGSEWDADLVLDEALRLGKQIALPRVVKEENRLALYMIENKKRDTAPGVFGILEPCMHCAHVMPKMIDWVLVPGVAFTERGERLGYGAGYYDRLLPLISPTTSLISGTFEAQMVTVLPVAKHDVSVDMVVNEHRGFGVEKPA